MHSANMDPTSKDVVERTAYHVCGPTQNILSSVNILWRKFFRKLFVRRRICEHYGLFYPPPKKISVLEKQQMYVQ